VHSSGRSAFQLPGRSRRVGLGKWSDEESIPPGKYFVVPGNSLANPMVNWVCTELRAGHEAALTSSGAFQVVELAAWAHAELSIVWQEAIDGVTAAMGGGD
jgi:hypothetical protein